MSRQVKFHSQWNDMQTDTNFDRSQALDFQDQNTEGYTTSQEADRISDAIVSHRVCNITADLISTDAVQKSQHAWIYRSVLYATVYLPTAPPNWQTYPYVLHNIDVSAYFPRGWRHWMGNMVVVKRGRVNPLEVIHVGRGETSFTDVLVGMWLADMADQDD
ncbi:hypothetical protein PILCRDRAFT_93185 [Piloderma croceum F 1598]|uniref:Uncharacterized protein n=1 Tax=Piloderma croceum (strain F 1598) TaxID=765440 RepID=A0A0C3EZN3_PILCF|nr:hypothetical protein PILCRDRAFT_93185 [Piloderma croceum F 1598]